MGGKRKCFQRPIITFILRFPFSPQYKCHLIAVVCGVVLTLLLKKILSKCNWVKLQFERNQLEMSMNTISQSFVLFKNLCLKKKTGKNYLPARYSLCVGESLLCYSRLLNMNTPPCNQWKDTLTSLWCHSWSLLCTKTLSTPNGPKDPTWWPFYP